MNYVRTGLAATAALFLLITAGSVELTRAQDAAGFQTQGSLPQGRARPLSAEEIGALPFESRAAGPNYRELYAVGSEGEVISRYTQMGTGINRWDAATGSWKPAFVQLELLEGGAVSRNTASEIIFSPGSDDPEGVFDILMPPEVAENGLAADKPRQRFRGQRVGIALTDRRTGQSVWIAEVAKVGGLAGDDEVIYPESLVGGLGVRASVRYRIRLHGMSQDVVIHTAIPSLQEAGFPAETQAKDVALEIWSNILDSPEPVIQQEQVRLANGKTGTDARIDFGTMKLLPGRAFRVEDEPEQRFAIEGETLPVTKEWAVIQGLTFLIEALPYEEALAKTAHLKALAVRKDARHSVAEAARKTQAEKKESRKLLASDSFAERRMPVSLAGGERARSPDAAKVVMRRQTRQEVPLLAGYVVDFETLNGPSETDKVFCSDQTYYITGYVGLYGTTILESATIKFANTNAALLIVDNNGALKIKTQPYRPAILTAKDDNTVGSVISGSTGTPVGFYAYYAFGYTPTTPINFSNVRVRFADRGLYFANWPGGTITNTVSDAQFVHCNRAIIATNGTLHVQNALLYHCAQAFEGHGTTFISQNVTVHDTSQFLNNLGSTTMIFTNSIFCKATNMPSITGSHNVTNNDAGAVFQEVGNSRNYLSDGYRNLGTTNIDSALRASLRKKTTVPPQVITGLTLDQAHEFYPVVQRDTDEIDPGYHFDPMDWAIGGVLINSGGELTIRAGTVVGVYAHAGYSGIEVYSGGKVTSVGTAEQPVRIVRYSSVQEQANNNWYPSFTMTGILAKQGGATEQGNLRWTEFYFDPGGSGSDYALHLFQTGIVSAAHCQFFGGQIRISDSVFKLTNGLFDRAAVWLTPRAGSYFQNCTFRQGTWTNLNLASLAGNLTVKDTLFDRTLIHSPTNATGSYNAYETNQTRLLPAGTGDLLLTSPMTYTNGPLGNFYQGTTALMNLGSVSASSMGLYHFAVEPSGTKETNSTVDIGFHYVAADANGSSIDTDQDFLPDYFEDLDGDGTADAGETDWLSATYLSDTNATINLRIFTPFVY